MMAFPYSLNEFSTELLLNIFSYLNIRDLCRLRCTCKRFNDIITSWDHTLISDTTATNEDSKFSSKCLRQLSALEKLRITRNWTKGIYHEESLLYTGIKMMPWLYMNSQYIWLSRGRNITCYERDVNMGINLQKNIFSLQSLNKEDVVNFQLSNNVLVSGLREGGIWIIDLNKKETISEKEYCHMSDVTSIDINQSGSLVVSGSKDCSLKFWILEEDPEVNLIEFHRQILADLIWKVTLSDNASSVAVGTSGRRHNDSIFIHDIERPTFIQHLGNERKPDHGISDLRWDGEDTLWSCGYNGLLKRWDLRIGNCVQSFTDPYGSGLYCMDYDYHNTVVVGTQMHGRVTLWDIRKPKCMQMYFMKSCQGNRYQRSSPIYSLAFDTDFLFTVTDQNLNVLDFSVYDGVVKDYSDYS